MGHRLCYLVQVFTKRCAGFLVGKTRLGASTCLTSGLVANGQYPKSPAAQPQGSGTYVKSGEEVLFSHPAPQEEFFPSQQGSQLFYGDF